MTATTKNAGDGVHRLVEMVVEEVSLVDRAANNHRAVLNEATHVALGWLNAHLPHLRAKGPG